jgi:hypothetical protein
MKKTLILTESELINVVGRIIESYNDDIYDDEDYIEVFLHYFRPWIKANHGDEIGEYPLSFLVKKYIAEFAEDNGIRPEEALYSYRNNLTNAANIGRRLVKMGKHKLPSLRSQENFTEKFKKPLEFFLNELNLPDYITLNFIEDTPFNVRVEVKVDWLELIKSKDEKSFILNTIKSVIEQRVTNFLGIELGNPTHGQLKLQINSPEYVGIDDWIKKDFNKVIKKKIKELPNASRIVHAIKFSVLGGYSLGGEITFSIKNYSGKIEFIKSVKELLQSMGYNTNILKVSS